MLIQVYVALFILAIALFIVGFTFKRHVLVFLAVIFEGALAMASAYIEIPTDSGIQSVSDSALISLHFALCLLFIFAWLIDFLDISFEKFRKVIEG